MVLGKKTYLFFFFSQNNITSLYFTEKYFVFQIILITEYLPVYTFAETEEIAIFI